ncbi:hypothetical protein JL475_12890 [Streptomyces sp. M2CJ-2]|uniref:hypothetical protein n=1 Tax=Streptomyces sp. M2CJ-2 TaxID=2803948 RepID=UPI0019278663|nr:hypothetical protein [Streptomyces sp. M2CJ-2]MBL3666874.1 hypothetical protein [Streptomyces sp. M2CJ-2]
MRRSRVLNGGTVPVSNASTGPIDNTWLAGPQSGRDAELLYRNTSRFYGGR